MIRPLVHDPIFLSQKSSLAGKEDLSVAKDLLDTLNAYKGQCVGMAANMIGVRKSIIAFENAGTYMVMLNPVILEKIGMYEAEEGCLSLLGEPRKAKRFQMIRVQYQTERLETRSDVFLGWTAQIIQHEVDHCNGILI